MKILLLHNRYIHRGGEEVCVENELEALKDAGIEAAVHWVDSHPGMKTMVQALAAPWGGHEMSRLRVKLEKERPDILHAHNLYPILSPRIFSIAKGLGIHTIQTLHNYRPLCLNGLFLTPTHEVCERCPTMHSFVPGIARGCYRDSQMQSVYMAAHLTRATDNQWFDTVDRFISPSGFLKDKFESHGFHVGRITVQGHFLRSIPASPPERSEPYLLYLGRLSEEKGVLWLCDLFKSGSWGCELRIAGDGPLRKEVEKRQSHQIRYLGYISGEDKSRIISKATALIMPSLCYENFPLSVMEANALGVPVIAPSLGGFTELVLPGVNGYTYSPEDPASAGAVIRRLTMENDPNLRTSSQNHARKHFSKSRFQQSRITLYESVLSKRI